MVVGNGAAGEGEDSSGVALDVLGAVEAPVGLAVKEGA